MKLMPLDGAQVLYGSLSRWYQIMHLLSSQMRDVPCTACGQPTSSCIAQPPCQCTCRRGGGPPIRTPGNQLTVGPSQLSMLSSLISITCNEWHLELTQAPVVHPTPILHGTLITFPLGAKCHFCLSMYHGMVSWHRGDCSTTRLFHGWLFLGRY